MSTQAPAINEEQEVVKRRLYPQQQSLDLDRLLPSERLERVPSWGESSFSMGYVYRPSTVEDIREILKIAKERGCTIGLRGAGNSYGDATLNEGNIIIDFRRMNRILAWDPQEGIIRVEPGVTISQLWQYTLEDGWWPSVVPGTGKPTIGGCAAMNIHGKNAWKQGTIGDHIEEFELMLPSGEVITCSRNENERLFYSAIGGFGMLGIFTSLTLKLSKMHSGILEVHALVSKNLQQMMEQFEEHLDSSDYLVGWIDAFARGSRLGRGQIHKANYLLEGDDPNPQQSMRLGNQHQPDTIFMVIPRSFMWRLMRPFMNDLGTRLVNFGKYWASRWTHGSTLRQPHVAFHFLLDYIPDWKRSYGPDGLIQYQCFVPKEAALDAFSEILRHCQKRRLTNYLTVLKRHRPDDFLITHGVDGYSMAMDFRVTRRKRSRLLKLAEELDDIVLRSGGRFYLAKDSTLRPDIVRAYLGDESVAAFRAMKVECDPDEILQTNLWRRLFPG
jgi:decaprenylphospho-beta-D-ribofuranose 2-oxidase